VAGATIAVVITKPNWLGKEFPFKTRAAREPSESSVCPVPGATHPSGKC
jgi:hypothetical protein